jgi:hypothetical protein
VSGVFGVFGWWSFRLGAALIVLSIVILVIVP